MSAQVKRTRDAARENSRARRKNEQRHAVKRRQYFFLGGIALMIALAGAIAGITLTRGGSGSSLPAVVAAANPIDPSIPQNGITLGDPSAKVTVTEWGDFQCPYCGEFARDVQPQLIADYVKTGKIQFVFKNIAFLGNESKAAAESADCASDQGKYWAMHDALYANQSGENENAFSTSRLQQIASVAGLDVTAYNACMAANTHATDVANEIAEGQKIPITSTPSFVIDGKVVVWTTYADLTSAIDAALTKAGA